jgi:inorganic triphosphatase YgiF
MAKRNKEFELKFTGSPTDIAALPRSLFLSAIYRDKGEWERLDTTYFDTSKGSIKNAGLSLRLREKAGRLVQTVKCAQAGGGCIERDEVEFPLAQKSDFPKRTGDTEIDSVIVQHAQSLMPIARTASDRWSAQVRFRSSQIEIAIDIGCVESWNEAGTIFRTPLAEIELELKTGSAADVFDLGRLLARNVPVRLSTRSKLETALALPHGAAGMIKQRKKSQAAPGDPVADILQRALSDIAFRLTDLQPVLVDMRQVEGVHQMRVALRRLRAVEGLFRPHLASKSIFNLANAARLFARHLEEARDWDVFLEETLPAALESGYAPHDANRLKAVAEAQRAEGWAGAVAAVSGPDFTVFLIDLMEAAVLAPWRQGAGKQLSFPASKFAPRALDGSLKKATKTAKRIRLDHLDELHQLRIALKKLRYPVQIFRSIYPKERRKAYMAALSALQESLGAVNDAVVAQRLANSAAAGNGDGAMRAAGFVCGYKAAEAEAAATQIRAAWPEFSATAPFWRE